MTHILILFLDGLGLGTNDVTWNPFAASELPTITGLLSGQALLHATAPYHGEHASLLALDAQLGVKGKPQSATGQATLLTGRNVAAEIGRHYGPKPTPDIAQILLEDNLFMQVKQRGGSAALLNAYPPQYFEAIERGHRLHAAIPMALTGAGIPLLQSNDLRAGRALSADFTGAGWNERQAFPRAPVYSINQAGALLADLARSHTLSWFDYWLTDVAGHRAGMQEAIQLLTQLDALLGSLVRHWNTHRDLLIVISDHGNIEDLHARGHTANPVPLLLIGPSELRSLAATACKDLSDLYPYVIHVLFSS